MLFASTAPPSPLRDYQRAALDAIASHYSDGVQRQLLSLPTGLGKTKIFTSVPERLGFSHDQLTLAVAHTDELVEQTVAAFEQALPAAWIEVEKANRRALSAASIVVGSVQTLRGRRLRDFFRRFGSRIALLVIDEAHRSIAASYQELVREFFEHAPRGLLLGVTATPRRSDNVGLDAIYQRIVYHMDIRAAIAQGYLVQIQGFRVGTSTSLEGVASRAGDFAIDQLAARVDTPERNARIVAAYATKTPERQAIVFAASVDHARHLAQCFREANVAAEALWGELPLLERRARLDSFRRRRLQVLVNFAILVEGVDVPATDVIIMCRPTRSGLDLSSVSGARSSIRTTISLRCSAPIRPPPSVDPPSQPPRSRTSPCLTSSTFRAGIPWSRCRRCSGCLRSLTQAAGASSMLPKRLSNLNKSTPRPPSVSDRSRKSAQHSKRSIYSPCRSFRASSLERRTSRGAKRAKAVTA